MNKSELQYILPIAKKIKMVTFLGGCCKECGETRFYTLDFHHLHESEKEFDIGKMKYCRWCEIEKELKKCICLCANCHREIHSQKNKELGRHSINKQILLDCINKLRCELCGYDKCISSLSFHHINSDEKEFLI